MTITQHQRRVLVEHAIDSNHVPGGATPEVVFADVIADLAMGRDVNDRDPRLVAFLWQRISIAVDAGPSRQAHQVWSAAVQLLDACGENLDDIFTGRQVRHTAGGIRTHTSPEDNGF